MRILHLTLGLPQYRSGGLPQYAYDLATAQSSLGHSVSMLYPGNVDIINKRSRIQFKKSISGISIYKVINSAYVPIPLGVNKPDLLMKSCDKKFYAAFLKKINPEIVHVHTFMGFHIEFFEIIKALGIKTIYSSHDYYAICPKTSLVNSNNELCSGCSAQRCAYCNIESSNSLITQIVLQSEWYSIVKRSKLVKILKKKRKTSVEHEVKNNIDESSNKETILNMDYINKYERYLNYQKHMLDNIDCIHFNSSISRDVYIPYISEKSYFIENITIGGLEDNRGKRYIEKSSNKIMNIGFIGIRDYHKGYWILRDAGMNLYNKGYRFKMSFYGDEYNIDSQKYPFCAEKGRFNHNDLEQIMSDIDILVVPGYWYETFGFTAIEAMANNVVVLISDHTGAKDVFSKVKTKHVFKANSDDLAECLEKYLNDNSYIQKAIEEQQKCDFQYDLSLHAQKMIQYYMKIV